jgi:hypothetical protein
MEISKVLFGVTESVSVVVNQCHAVSVIRGNEFEASMQGKSGDFLISPRKSRP